jgi:uncharacterized protein (TIGR03089 family)
VTRAVPTPYDLLGRFPDGSRPFVTHYAGPDARVELSVATTRNAVAKAAGLLRDGLGAPPGAVVSIDLPRHWQLPVWVLAALSAGAACGRELAGPVDIRVVGPDGLARLAAGADPRADEVVACACDTFGLPVPGGVPAGVLDAGVEVRAHPDRYAPEPAAAGRAALLHPGRAVPWADVVGASEGGAAAPDAHGDPGARTWVDETIPDADLVEAVAIGPLLRRGSVVIAKGLAAEQAARIRGLEGVTFPATP